MRTLICMLFMFFSCNVFAQSQILDEYHQIQPNQIKEALVMAATDNSNSESDYGKNSSLNLVKIQVKSVYDKKIDLQIPLIWYTESF